MSHNRGQFPRFLRRFCVAATVAVMLIAARAESVRAQSFAPENEDVILRDRLGNDDFVSFFFEPGTDFSARQRIADAARASGIPNYGITRVYDRLDNLIMWRLDTTLGLKTGFLERTIPQRVMYNIDIFSDHDPLSAIVEPPINATILAGNVTPFEDADEWRRLAVYGSDAVTYREDPSALYGPPFAIAVAALLCFSVARRRARAIDGKQIDLSEKIHKLRVLSFVGMLFVITGGVTSLVLGGDQLNENLLGALAPSVTRIHLLVGAFGVVCVAAAFGLPLIAFNRGWAPTYRRLREIQKQPLRRRLRIAVAVLVPLAVWFAFLSFVIHRFFTTEPASIIAVGTSLIVFQLAVPLFARRLLPTKPLDPMTRARLDGISRRLGVPIRDIRVLDASGSKVANAFVMGLTQRTRTVLITDVLLEKFTPQEVDAVFAHELGHAKGRHVPIKLAVVYGTLVLFYAGAALTATISPDGGGAVAAGLLPLVLIVMMFVTRGRIGIRLEEKADDFGADAVGTVAMCSALDRLAEVNHTRRNTGRFFNTLTQHPGVAQRIARLRARLPVGQQQANSEPPTTSSPVRDE